MPNEERPLEFGDYLVGILADDPLAVQSMKAAVKRLSDDELAEFLNQTLDGSLPAGLAEFSPEQLARLCDIVRGLVTDERRARKAERN